MNSAPTPGDLIPRSVVCVFASSSRRIDPSWSEAASHVGAALNQFDLHLSYGGCLLGLMGEAALSARRHGRGVLGVIPKKLVDLGEADEDCTELVIVSDLAERKRVLVQRSGGFLALPGGVGTFDEIFEVLALRQVGEIHSPLALVNDRGFYDPLLTMLEQAQNQGFLKGLIAKEGACDDLIVADSTMEAVELLARAMGQKTL
jgi:uncharacterized protein (TIGR00730 family)